MDLDGAAARTGRAVPIPVVVSLAAGALFVPLVLPLTTGRIFTMDDLTLLHLPARVVYARALAAGDEVAWTSAFFAGYYLHGEGQTGMFHPLHMLLYSLLPLTEAFNLEIVCSYAFAFAGTVLLLRRWDCATPAALVGGVAFAFSGFNLFHLVHVNLVAVGAHLPWLLWAAERISARRTLHARMVAGVAFAAILGSSLLLGFPQLVLFCGIAVASYAIWMAWERRDWTGLPWLFGAALAGGALGAVQVLPTLDVLAASVRSDPSIAFRHAFSLHPMNVLQLLTPYLFREGVRLVPAENAVHESVVYNGAYCTLALCWVVAAGRRLLGRPIASWAIAMGLLAVVLALGRYGGAYAIVAAWPLFRWFRAPARFVFLLHFALSVVAAVAFDDLLKRTRGSRPRAREMAALAIPVVLAGAAAVALQGGPARATAGVAIVAGTAALVRQAASGRRWALVLLPIALAVDLGVWGYRYVWKGPPATIAVVAARADQPAEGQPGELLYSEFEPNLPVLNGLRAFNAYVGLTPSRVLDSAQETTQRVAGVVWRRMPSGWERVDRPSPRVRLVTTARLTSNARRDLPATPIERMALVHGPVSLDGQAIGRAEVIVDRPGEIAVAVETTGRVLLVTTESYHPGWRATASSQALDVIRVNGDFLGCIVEPGTSRVDMRFAPRSLSTGRAISQGALLVLTLLALGFATASRIS